MLPSKDLFGILCWTLIAIITIWGVSFFFATLFECIPIHLVWETFYGEPDRSCYNYEPMFLAIAITNMIIDVAILSAPMPEIWKLKMPVRQKLAVSAIFLLGAL